MFPPKIPECDYWHPGPGLARYDEFHWLKDPNWRQVLQDPAALNASVRQVLNSENDYAKFVLDPLNPRIETFYHELCSKEPAAYSPPPIGRGPWLYGHRFEVNADRPIFYRRPREGSSEQVLFDAQALGSERDFFSVSANLPSPDHRYWVASVDTTGSERHQIVLRDCQTGTFDWFEDDAAGPLAWSLDSQVIFWLKIDEEGRPSSLWRRKIGEDFSVLVLEEADPAFYLDLRTSADGRWIVVEASTHETVESWAVDASAPDLPAVAVVPRSVGRQAWIDRAEHDWVIRSNHQVPDFAMYRSSAPLPTPETWVLIDSPGVRLSLEKFVVIATWVIVLERCDGQQRLRGIDLVGGGERLVANPGVAGSWQLASDQDDSRLVVRARWSAPHTPPEDWEFSLESLSGHCIARRDVPSGHNPDLYHVTRTFATSPDGERVPVTLLRRNDTILNETTPVWLYGYGAYGYSLEDSWSAGRLCLADHGWLVVIAHVRGGSEKGRSWFMGGRGLQKQRTFDDFIAVAEFLIRERVTHPGRIVAHGVSAGGLLVGAVLNQRPELWGCVCAEVPFVDVLTTMSDAGLPLTPMEWPEWGNPLDDETARQAIAAYSPYDNVTKCPYPAVFATAGLADPRVTYWEPAKWIARLRKYSTSSAPLMLKTEMTAGHGGGSGRFQRFARFAELVAFASDQLKV